MLDRVAKNLAPVRVEDWSAERGQIAEIIRQLGGRSSVGVPIVVDGRVWRSLARASLRSGEPVARHRCALDGLQERPG